MFNLFSKKKQTSPDQKINDDILAVISLLVEAANIDEEFKEKEKKTIRDIIKKQFLIQDDNVIDKTMDEVLESLNNSGDLVSHTKKIKDSWSFKKRKEVIEMLWKVCLIDNNLDPYEDLLIRKIASLLYVDAKDSNEAKRKVLEALNK